MSATKVEERAFPKQFWANIDDLLSHPKNYKVHPQDQIDNVAADLKRFGQRKPIVVQAQEGVITIIAGHCLVLSAQQLSQEYAAWKRVWATLVPDDWSVDEAEGYLIADNESSRGAENNNNTLMELLTKQYSGGYDLASLGFSSEDYKHFVSQMTREHATDFLDDILERPLEEESLEEQLTALPSDVTYFTVSYALTIEQRTTVLSALKKAKLAWDIQTSNMALTRICQEFLDRN